MIKMELDIDDAMHSRLTNLARSQGRSLPDLVREALASIDCANRGDDRKNSLTAIAGLWKDRTDLPSTSRYVRRMRRKGFFTS